MDIKKELLRKGYEYHDVLLGVYTSDNIAIFKRQDGDYDFVAVQYRNKDKRRVIKKSIRVNADITRGELDINILRNEQWQ